MSIALELRGVSKGVAAGMGTCVAHAYVLRDCNLTIATSEVVAIVGSSAAVSTLVLCAVGILSPDVGIIRWFGDASREAACHRVLHHRAAIDSVRDGVGAVAHLHVLDASSVGEQTRIARWASERSALGDAVLVAASEESWAHHIAARVLRLSAGRLLTVRPPHARDGERPKRQRLGATSMRMSRR